MAVLSSLVGVMPPALPERAGFLREAGVKLRRSQFSIVAAAPAVGKSTVATNYAIRTGVPSLYFSADSDEWTVRPRCAAILTGKPLAGVEQDLTDPAWLPFYQETLSQADNVDWCYRSDIDLDFIIQRVKAHKEVRGPASPSLIVVDNLTNTVTSDDEYGELRGTCRALQGLARTTGAHVMALHHVTGAKENGDQPIWLGDLLGKIGKIPEIVIGFNRMDQQWLNMTVAKNRGGPSGRQYAVSIDYSRATVGGFQ